MRIHALRIGSCISLASLVFWLEPMFPLGDNRWLMVSLAALVPAAILYREEIRKQARKWYLKLKSRQLEDSTRKIPADGQKVAELIIKNKDDKSEAQRIFYRYINILVIFNEVWASHALSYVLCGQYGDDSSYRDERAYEKLRSMAKGTEYEIHASTRFDIEFSMWLLQKKIPKD